MKNKTCQVRSESGCLSCFLFCLEKGVTSHEKKLDKKFDNLFLEKFKTTISTINYNKSENIIKQGVNLNNIYIVKQGTVKQYYELENGRNIIFNLLGENSIIGFTDIHTDTPVNFSISALVESQVCSISIDLIKELIKKDFSISDKILKYINQKNESFSSKIISFTQKNANQRVSELIFYLSHYYGSNEFTLSLSRQEMADMCLLSREAFSKSISFLKRHHVIELKAKNLRIIDLVMLEKYIH